MASSRISTPMRGVTSQLTRLSIRRDAVPTAASTSFVRTITTSPSSHASVSSITTSADAPIIPLEDRTVTATIHHFPSLEPLRFEQYPANHLYLPTRRDILHRAVIFEGDSTRFGNANTKWRSEVNGSARKVRPQKGTGRARLGDRRSPMLKGGGVAFGPKPRDFATGLQKKVYDLAWRTALSYRFRKGQLIIVDNALEIETPSTTHLQHIFDNHRWGGSNGRSILVTLEERPMLAKVMAEKPKAGWTAPWNEVDVKDMLSLGRIVIERKALQNILLSHQEDLVRSRYPPKLEKYDPPIELEQIVGWSEFRDLELATPAELEDLRPELYEQLAEKKIAEAQRQDPVEGTRLLVSAYQLKSEVARLWSEKIARHNDINLVDHDDEELRVQGLTKRVELRNMQATRSEYKAEALRLQNRLQDAEEWRAEAETYELEAAEDQVTIDEILGIATEDAESTEVVEEQRP